MTFKLLRVKCCPRVLSGSVWLVWRRAQDDADLFCCLLPNSHSQRRFSVRFPDSGLQGSALASCDGALICSSLEDFIKITSNSRRKVAPSTVLLCWLSWFLHVSNAAWPLLGICRVACSVGWGGWNQLHGLNQFLKTSKRKTTLNHLDRGGCCSVFFYF